MILGKTTRGKTHIQIMCEIVETARVVYNHQPRVPPSNAVDDGTREHKCLPKIQV